MLNICAKEPLQKFGFSEEWEFLVLTRVFYLTFTVKKFSRSRIWGSLLEQWPDYQTCCANWKYQSKLYCMTIKAISLTLLAVPSLVLNHCTWEDMNFVSGLLRKLWVTNNIQTFFSLNSGPSNTRSKNLKLREFVCHT